MKATATANFEVIGIGAATLDTLHLVPDFPTTEGVTQIIESATDGGGPVATALCYLASRGHSCGLLDSFGDDPTSALIRQGLARHGVQLVGTNINTDSRSATAQILVRQRDGARHILFQPGTAPAPEWNAAYEEQLSKASLLHINGRHENAARAAVKSALDHGIPISFDGGAGRYRDSIRDLVKAAQIRILSRSFAAEYVGSTHLAVIAEALKSDVLVITAGTEGSWFWDRAGHHFHQPAIPAERLVDTTGCGDIYHGAFLHGWLNCQPLPECARHAALEAAANTVSLGGRAILRKFDVKN
ncbi:MAG: carbohydrate kinase family protein [Verrucomicrobiaceae bacterium]|nr:carbohydrate kinase family protein [Verrucomicrobiaceae bacterium]